MNEPLPPPEAVIWCFSTVSLRAAGRIGPHLNRDKPIKKRTHIDRINEIRNLDGLSEITENNIIGVNRDKDVFVTDDGKKYSLRG